MIKTTILFIIIFCCCIYSQVSAETNNTDTLKVEDGALKSKAQFYFGAGRYSSEQGVIPKGEVLTFHFQKHIFPHVEVGPQAAYYFLIDSIQYTGDYRLGIDIKYNIRDNMKKTDLFLMVGFEIANNSAYKSFALNSFGIGIESPAINRIQFFGMFEQVRSDIFKTLNYTTISFGIKILNPMLTKDDHVNW